MSVSEVEASPATATEPFSSWRLESTFVIASIASGTTPPYMPECTA
ncbi:Uncharacterised protein [Mycobacteroides abscessus subsp. abscessus]|nr:Uncharacterised protein [Mycobacteroides abscessus subsp. abscessus]